MGAADNKKTEKKTSAWLKKQFCKIAAQNRGMIFKIQLLKIGPRSKHSEMVNALYL